MPGNIHVVEAFVTRMFKTAPTDLLPEAAPSHLKRLCWEDCADACSTTAVDTARSADVC